ncbi:MAG: hypothetical protein JO360_13975 [Acidobacteria bacterium]|nr:hypothetical protein [Acidobacteriota bacterium]
MSGAYLFFIKLSTDGAIWRAVFVALVALIAFALTRYWRSLSGHTLRTRLALVTLRAVSLLLVASALAGVRVEYDSQNSTRVLIYRGDARDNREAVRQLTASLKAKNLEAVETEGQGSYLAAILLTDGALRAADARDAVEGAHAAAGGSTVYVLAASQTDATPSVALESVSVVNRVTRGVPFVVRCQLHARGMRGRATLLKLSDEAQVRASAEARWTSDDERQSVTLEVVPKTAGWINYTARAEAAASEDASTLTRPFTVYAEERRQRVLFFEGEPTWEAKFVRRALEESELFTVDYFAQVSRAAMVGAKENAGENTAAEESAPKKDEAASGSPEAKLHAALASAARLNAYDCIIVGATPDALLSGPEAARISEWVERRGGGLVVLGGNSFAGSIVAPKGKLTRLLPIEIDASSFRTDSDMPSQGAPVEAEKTRGGSALTPTAAGAGAALSGYLNALQGQERTSPLSGQGLRLKALRAGASVLAVAGAPGADGTSEAGAPLIAATRAGAGRTLVFAPSDSWRIRTSASGEEAGQGGAFAALWEGLALWAASGAHAPVEIALGEISPAAGSDATAEIRVLNESYAPLKIEKLSARLQPLIETTDEAQTAEPSSIELAFAPDANDPSIWRAHFIAPQPARFNLQIKYTAGGISGTAEKYFATVAPTALEAGAAFDTLRRAARETGGELFAASDAEALTRKLDAQPHTRQTIRRTWDARTFWPLALIIPLLLSCEWLIQRIRSQVPGPRSQVKDGF